MRPRHLGHRSWRDDHSGQAMIETALLMPFIFLLILMVIEMGFLLWMNLNVGQAAREAARAAAVGKDVGANTASGCKTETDTVKARAFAAAVGRIECGDVKVFYVDGTGPTTIGRGDDVIVKIDHDYDSLTGFFRMIGASAFQIHACADARVETPPSPGEAAAHPPLAPADRTCVSPTATPTP
ncbi:MAG: TadE/TadG family type IV pilus assembly protein [Dehalococcoidia bacterium]